MRRLSLLGAVLALILCCAVDAGAASSAQDGQSFRGVTQIDLVGGMVRADSSAKAHTMDTSGNLKTSEASPLNTQRIAYATVYADTLSFNGRNLDSTATITDVSNFRFVNLGIKFEGAQGAAGGVIHLGVTCVMSHSAVASDTTLTFCVPILLGTNSELYADSIGTGVNGVTGSSNAGSVFGGCEANVTGVVASAVSMPFAVLRTATLSYYNPGYSYARWYFRVLSQPQALDTGAGTRQRFALLAVVSGRAL